MVAESFCLTHIHVVQGVTFDGSFRRSAYPLSHSAPPGEKPGNRVEKGVLGSCLLNDS